MTRISNELLELDLDLMWEDWATSVVYKKATANTVNLNTGVTAPTATSYSVTGIVSENNIIGQGSAFKRYPAVYAKYEVLLHLRVSDIAFEPQASDRVTIDGNDWSVDYVGKDGSGTKWLLGLVRAK